MKNSFKLLRSESQPNDPESAIERKEEDSPLIVTMGRISDLTLGTVSPKVDDPNKWGDKG